MNTEQFENIDEGLGGVLGWVSNWWNPASNYIKHLYNPLSKLMGEDDIKQLDHYIRNSIWPELEIEFAERIMEYIESYLVEDD